MSIRRTVEKIASRGEDDRKKERFASSGWERKRAGIKGHNQGLHISEKRKGGRVEALLMPERKPNVLERERVRERRVLFSLISGYLNWGRRNSELQKMSRA